MSFGFFSWLRTQAKQAILAGVGDAVDELDNPDTQSADVDGWRKKLAESAQPKALPAAKDDEPKKKAK